MNSLPSDVPLAERLRPVARFQQIIVIGLASSAILFLGVAIFLRQSGNMNAAAGPEDLLPIMGLAAAAAAVVGQWLVPLVIQRQSRAAIAAGTFQMPPDGGVFDFCSWGDAGALASVFQTRSIVAAAILEAAALFNGVTYLLIGSLLALGVAFALAAFLLTKITSAARMADWIEGQLRLISEEKSLSR